MEFAVKNVILYDEFGSVSGFVEFKIRRDRTDIKVRQNLNEKGLALSVIANGEAVGTFEINGAQSSFELRRSIDAEKEIFVYLKRGEETIASGVINQGQIDRRIEVSEVIKTSPVEVVKELDEILRKVCIIDENGGGQCESCPYRDYFFGEGLVSAGLSQSESDEVI